MDIRITLTDAQADAAYLGLVGADPLAPGAPDRPDREAALRSAVAGVLRRAVEAGDLRLAEVYRDLATARRDAETEARTAADGVVVDDGGGR